MLHNINTIQNLTDITYNTSYTDEYLINALANAGQRLGIKGDSISIGSFTFKNSNDRILKFLSEDTWCCLSL